MSTSSSSTDDQSYSLRLRLLSAVDLPPSLSPNVPLCPWFELGLVNTSANDDDGADNEGDADGMEHREKRELHPKWEAEEEDEKPQQQQQQMDKSSHGKESEACRLLKRLKGRDVRTSAFKIMTKVSVC
jgi:hypothetical protein